MTYHHDHSHYKMTMYRSLRMRGPHGCYTISTPCFPGHATAAGTARLSRPLCKFA